MHVLEAVQQRSTCRLFVLCGRTQQQHVPWGNKNEGCFAGSGRFCGGIMSRINMLLYISE
jgi:hypothetical protein